MAGFGCYVDIPNAESTLSRSREIDELADRVKCDGFVATAMQGRFIIFIYDTYKHASECSRKCKRLNYRTAVNTISYDKSDAVKQMNLASMLPIERDLADCLNEIKRLETNVTKLQAMVSSLNSQVGTLKKQKEEAEQSCAVLKKQLKSHDEQHEKEMRKLREMNRNWAHENEQLAAEIFDLTRRLNNG